MAEHNELGKWEEMAVEFEEDGYTILQITTLFKQKLIFLPKRKHTCCCRSQNAFFFGLPGFFLKKSSFLLKLLMPCKQKEILILKCVLIS
jgi:hypothetical protein